MKIGFSFELLRILDISNINFRIFNHLEMIINDGKFKNIDKSTKMQKQTEDERYVLF